MPPQNAPQLFTQNSHQHECRLCAIGHRAVPLVKVGRGVPTLRRSRRSHSDCLALSSFTQPRRVLVALKGRSNHHSSHDTEVVRDGGYFVPSIP
jgi:hypothetical protein